MALDKEYFDAIHFKVAKKKYYNARKVDAVLEDIRSQAEALIAENERMQQALSSLAERRVELGDAVLSAQGVYKSIVDAANAQGAEIVAEAQRRAAEIVEETQRQQDEGVRRVERCFTSMKRQHKSAIEELNKEWQEYLCTLYPAPEAPEAAEESAPEDLEEKVDAIARELFSFEEGEAPDEEEDPSI